MDEQLEPCPFCGADAAICGGSEYGFYVVCNNLGCYCALGEGYDRDAMPNHSFRDEGAALAAWNTRAHSASGDEHG